MSALAERLRDMTPILTVLAEDTRTLIDDSFQASKSPDGTPWAPLSDATIRIKPRRAGGKPLVDTARLRNSITAVGGTSSLRFGTNTKYAGPHQLGANVRVFGRGSPKTLQARPFLPIAGTPGRFSLMTTGAAGTHWTRVRADIRAWLRDGVIP
jgi:phage virion morphogenesis protein